MTTSYKHGYAFGVGVRARNGLKRIAHNGAVSGFSSYLAYYPDEHLTVTVLSNRAGCGADKIALALCAVAHEEPVNLPVKRVAVSVPEAVLQRYVGAYELNPQRILTVTVEGGQLAVQATDQPKFTMLAESERKFFLEMVDVQIEFTVDAAGVATSLTFFQAGQSASAKKK